METRRAETHRLRDVPFSGTSHGLVTALLVPACPPNFHQVSHQNRTSDRGAGMMTNQVPRKAFDVTALFAPARLEDFFREYWEHKPLHLSRLDAHYYDTVLTNGDFERIISSADLRYPAIQLARDGGYLAPEAYTKNIKHGTEVFNAVPDLERIQSEYNAGSTVVLPALQRIWVPLRRSLRGPGGTIQPRRACQCLFDAGRHSPGFTPHYDAHDVFVLQIAGAKRWRVFVRRCRCRTAPSRSRPWAKPAGTDRRARTEGGRPVVSAPRLRACRATPSVIPRMSPSG